MATGRIDYAPDYKSEKYIPCSSTDDRSEAEWTVIDTHNLRVAKARDAELARLEREVIDAVRTCRTQPGSSWAWLQPSGAYGPEVCGAWAQLEAAADALIEFESQEKK